jgi:crotonobetainyl-CoA:carnitine CoA-transferase CaiB-like acyl-CoA transferase
VAHPQVQALDILQPVPDAGFQLTALPLVIDGQRPRLRGAAPALGEHNAAHGAPARD